MTHTSISLNACPMLDIEMFWIRKLTRVGRGAETIGKAINRSKNVVAAYCRNVRSCRVGEPRPLSEELLHKIDLQCSSAREEWMAINKVPEETFEKPGRVIWRRIPTFTGFNTITLPAITGIESPHARDATA